MGHSAHRGTVGHTIGSQIIGKESQPKPDDNTIGQTATGFSHIPDIHVKGAANGVSVTHTPKQEQGTQQVGKPETPVEEQLHVFRSATEAHNHIGQLLGVRIASGAQEV